MVTSGEGTGVGSDGTINSFSWFFGVFKINVSVVFYCIFTMSIYSNNI